MTTKSGSIAETKDMITMPLEALEGLQSGVLKVDHKGDITFANTKFCEIAGVESWEGLNIRNLLPDEPNYDKAYKGLMKRLHELIAERYRLYLTRPDDGSRIYVEVDAFPETDSNFKGIGSIAIIRDVSAEDPARAIHLCIETERDWKKLFHGVAEAIKEVLPFEWFNITLYSEDGKHVRELFSVAEQDLPRWGVRWYKMPPIALRMIKTQKPLVISDMDAHLAQPGWESILEDPTTQQFLQLGYKSCLWYPVLQQGKIVAAVTLYSKSSDRFSKHHMTIMEALPMRRAVGMGLYHLQQEDIEFRLGLIKDIATIISEDNDESEENDEANARSDIERAAHLLVSRVKDHYQWDNVSLFRVDEDQREFRLVDESYEDKSHAFGKDYHQKIDEGILGYVVENKKSIRSGNIHADPVLKGRFKKGIKGDTISELTIPVMVKNRVCAVLNSEDTRANAYSADEQKALELVVGEVASLYKTIRLQMLLCAVLDSARDAIIRTNKEGVIQWVNNSASEILGYPKEQLVGASLGEHLADPSLARFLLKPDNVPNDRVVISRGDGTTRDLLLSGASLPKEIGGRVYVASDMSRRRREERLEYLDSLFHELASQSQVPLSLSLSWLRQLSKQGDEETVEILAKAMRQLKKAQLTFDRLSVYERNGSTIPYNPILLDVEYILLGVREELPKSESERIVVDVAHEPKPLQVRGDLFQLAFCFNSTLSYLAKYLPPKGKIYVSANLCDGDIEILIRGAAPELESKPLGAYADEEWSSHILLELSLGRDALKRMLGIHGGGFEGPEYDHKEVVFRITIPAASGDMPE